MHKLNYKENVVGAAANHCICIFYLLHAKHWK